jgi:hypothetical protein
MFAAAVALLLILSDAVLYYSRWILSDPTFLAFSLGALWALERGSERGREGEGRWVNAGLLLVLMAYFTRSAGLPLVVAVVLWMVLRRAWKRAAVFSLLFLPLAAFWGWRGAGSGTSGYVPEFWLVDPYRPDLGQVGLSGLGVRIWENLWAYVTDLVPEGLVGLEGAFLPILGGGVAVLAAVGWSRTLKEGPRLGELFFPLYLGLLLLWPQVWSGDRFALPLFPFFILYGASALVWVLRGLGAMPRNVLLGGAFLAVALPALRNWTLEAEAARECRAVAKEIDAWSCQGLGVREYVMLADWAGRNLPGGAVVVARKPRIFFVQSGLKAVPLPFTRDPEAFLASAGDAGAEYLTVDRWDGLSAYYLPPVLNGRPESFCYLTGVESGGEVGIRLLGIRAGSDVSAPPGRGLPRCPEEKMARGPVSRDLSSKGEIPLLVRGGAGRP